MWKAGVQNVKASDIKDDDDWDTDADFVNNVSEQEQRWGSKAVEGSGKPTDAVDLSALRNQVTNQHESAKKQEYQSKPGFSYGYGGKFGVQTDRMDKSAVGFEDMTAPTGSHSSVPKYERPAIAVKPTDIKKRFESTAAVNVDRVEEARKARAEKDRLDRERVKAEQEAQRSKELAQARDEEERRKIEEAQERARAEEQEAIRREQEAKLASERRAREEVEAQLRAQEEAKEAVPEDTGAAVEEAQQEADTQYSAYVAEESAATFEGGLTATALYEYEATGDDELGFGEGDLITNIEMIDEGWWRGECNGRYGLFPANYVQANHQ